MALHPITQPDAGNSALRILLVEDSEIDRDLVRRLLTVMWPHRDELQIDFATEGYGALDMLHDNSYAMLLLDWRLPGMDGGHLLAALARTGIRVPVVVLTCLERSELKVNIEEYGAVFLHKDNLNIGNLHQAIATALSNVLRSDTPAQPAKPANLPTNLMPSLGTA